MINNNSLSMRKACFAVAVLLWVTMANVNGQDHLQLQFSFEGAANGGTQVTDDTDRGITGTLHNGAEITQLGDFQVLNLGSDNGYFDMGAAAGDIIALLDDFSISTYVFVEESTDLWAAGNFVWAFGNSANLGQDQNGGMFLRAPNARYAISLQHWPGEQTVSPDWTFPKGTWKHVTYVQSGNQGSIFVDGEVIASGEITITPQELGKTGYNFLGRSFYSGDQYLKDSYITDFRIYDKPLVASEISGFSTDV